MDFQLNPDQEALHGAIARFLGDAYAFDTRKAREADAGFGRTFWRQAGELGMAGVAVAAEHGGLGLSSIESMLLHRLCGANLVREPFLWADAALQLLGRLGSEEEKAALIPAAASGAAPLILAHREGSAADGLDAVAATAEPTPDGYVLSGTKILVAGANLAHAFVVTAKTQSGETGAFLVPADAPRLSARPYLLIDGRAAADLRLEAVAVPAGARIGGDAGPALAYAVDYLLLGLAAETVGAVERCIAVTRDYLRTRQQFGRPIGSFQALQHRMADMLVEQEQCQSIFLRGLSLLEGADGEARRDAAILAKAKTGAAGRMIAGQAVQLHGGIGVTEEYVIGQLLKRVVANDILYGSSASHYRSFAERQRNRPEGGF